MKTFIIVAVDTNKMVDNGSAGSAFEGEDGKARAYELVNIHNKLWPNKQWKVVEEQL